VLTYLALPGFPVFSKTKKTGAFAYDCTCVCQELQRFTVYSISAQYKIKCTQLFSQDFIGMRSSIGSPSGTSFQNDCGMRSSIGGLSGMRIQNDFGMSLE